jgi:hypothetical protein
MLFVFSGVSQRWEFKNTTKNVLQKNRIEKFLQKNRQNRSKTDFWAFLGEGSSKTPQTHFCKKSMSKKNPKQS